MRHLPDELIGVIKLLTKQIQLAFKRPDQSLSFTSKQSTFAVEPRKFVAFFSEASFEMQ
ncbi:hypothetical protein [Salinicola salarius]|uniref:hypothetical protein n=1 Tax=Salinicola salarius TaxID=430457 RepID=UPI0013003DB2|nr:hypothetical protein [Salinicola salarius]